MYIHICLYIHTYIHVYVCICIQENSLTKETYIYKKRPTKGNYIPTCTYASCTSSLTYTNNDQ